MTAKSVLVCTQGQRSGMRASTCHPLATPLRQPQLIANYSLSGPQLENIHTMMG